MDELKEYVKDKKTCIGCLAENDYPGDCEYCNNLLSKVELIEKLNTRTPALKAENKKLTVNRNDYKKMYINSQQQVKEHAENGARMANELHDLEAENKKLREALNKYQKVIQDHGNKCDGMNEEFEELFNDIWIEADQALKDGE